MAKLWKDVSEGNKAVVQRSNLASERPYRVGVGISELAETLNEAIACFKQPIWEKMLKPEVLTKALAEAGTLASSLDKLDRGKGSEAESSSGKPWSVEKVQQEAPSESAGTARGW